MGGKILTLESEKLIKRGKIEGKAEGRVEGQTDLIKATQDARKGVSYDALANIYGEETAKNALLLK